MAYIQREIEKAIGNRTPPKAVVLFGPRKSGKTTLLRSLTNQSSVRWFNGDFPEDVNALRLDSTADIKNVLSLADSLVIDEAQRFPDIGMLLKRLVDVNVTLEKPTRIFASASTSFDLAKGIQESAVGRLAKRHLWPISATEFATNSCWGALSQSLNERLVYGMYPGVLEGPENARETLQDYVDGILFKDFFSLSGIRLNAKFERLVYQLALSVGSEVSYESLARETGLNKTTVMDYITLLEQCFIVKVCHSFSRNLGNELKKGKKVYFCDNGIRNAILGNFSPIASRSDAGALWENFFFMERIKLHDNEQDFAKVYFWRTTGRRPAEVDLVEVKDGQLSAFECKLNDKTQTGISEAFRNAYPEAQCEVATPRKLFQIFNRANR